MSLRPDEKFAAAVFAVAVFATALSVSLGEKPTQILSFAHADTRVEIQSENEDQKWFEDRKKQIDCLAENIYHEARSESTAGRIAVAHVTLNRVSAAGFPSTICRVVKSAKFDETGLPIRNRCAFSWYCDGLEDRIHDRPVFEEIHKLAQNIVEGEHYAEDITDGSTHYHNHTVMPRWASKMVKTTVIEGHIFYREKY